MKIRESFVRTAARWQSSLSFGFSAVCAAVLVSPLTSAYAQSSSSTGPRATVCCHLGLYTESKLKSPDSSATVDVVISQGDYFSVQLPPKTPVKLYQVACETLGSHMLDSFRSTALEIDKTFSWFEAGLLVFSSDFEEQRDREWDLNKINEPISSKFGESDTRTDTITVRTADPAMCGRSWCGVEGSITGESDKEQETISSRQVVRRSTASYRYYHMVDNQPEPPTTAKWEKLTIFSFPVQKVDEDKACNCQSMLTSYPPHHSGIMDAVLPARDWIVPPSTSSTESLSSDGKYSRNLCPKD